MTNQEYLKKLSDENFLLAQNLNVMVELLGGIDDTRFFVAFRKYTRDKWICERLIADIESGKLKPNDEYIEHPLGKTG